MIHRPSKQEVSLNEIKVKRILLAGLAMLVIFIAAELLVEPLIGRLLFGKLVDHRWLRTTGVGNWTAMNHLVNIGIALLNCTILIWVYEGSGNTAG